MQCDKARDLIGACIDRELAPDDRRAVLAHQETCADCAAEAADIARIGDALRAAGREPASRALTARVRSALAAVDASEGRALTQVTRQTAPTPAPAHWTRRHAPLLRAAALVAACMITALTTWVLAQGSARDRLSGHDVLAAHVRSLLQDSPIQVASSDQHTVKPWFAGRLDFSPNVKDLAAEGFPLVGGRLDYVGGRRVGAVVYRRRIHTINVFMWPSDGPQTVAARQSTEQGYNVVTWSTGGVTYAAVSDLNLGELQQLQSLF